MSLPTTLIHAVRPVDVPVVSPYYGYGSSNQCYRNSVQAPNHGIGETEPDLQSDLYVPDNSGSIVDLQAQIDVINTEITTIEGDITSIEGDITSINNDITTIEGDITNIEADVAALSGAATSLGPVGSSPNANAATLASNVLNLEPASASFPGVVTTSAQSFAGDKTFTDDVFMTGLPVQSAPSYVMMIDQSTGQITTSAASSTGVTAVAPIDSFAGPNADAAEISGNEISLMSATAAFPGIVNVAAQTFAGDKTFTGFVETEKTFNLPAVVDATTGCILQDGEPVFYVKPNFSVAIGTNIANFAQGGENTSVGNNTGTNMTGTAQGNVLVGSAAGAALTDGTANTCVGGSTGTDITTQQYNTLIGFGAGGNIESSSNTCVGHLAGQHITTGANNVAIGKETGRFSTGSNCIALGYQAGSTLMSVDNTINIGNVGTNTAGEINIGTAGTHTTTNLVGTTVVNGNISATNLSGTNTGNVSLAAVGAVPNANGASLAGQVLTLQPASASFPGLVSTGAQTIAGAKTFNDDVATVSNLALANATASTNGVVTVGGTRWMHNFTAGGGAKSNVFIGLTTGNFTMTSTGANVAIGQLNCQNLTTGIKNVTVGHNCSPNLSSGNNNVVLGVDTSGLTTGSSNIFVGFGAGNAISTTSNNICIGSAGTAGDAGAIKIGTNATHTTCQIQGISGATSTAGVAVLVNAAGVLGTTTSSMRFKNNINDVTDAPLDKMLSLPVHTFTYKNDPTNKLQYGMIAEEVAQIESNWCAFDNDDPNMPVNTVRYLDFIPLLVAAVSRSEKKIAELKAEIELLKSN